MAWKNPKTVSASGTPHTLIIGTDMENEAPPHNHIYISGDSVELKYLGGTRYSLAGSLVMFGDGIKSSDFVTDWFADDTDYDLRADGTGEATVYYNHGLDPVIGKAKLGNSKAKLTKREKDIWLEHELDSAKEYDEMVITLIQKRQSLHRKNFGFSSGAPSHLIEREQQEDGSNKITKWSLGSDASITLVPADWRQVFTDSATLQPVKSITELLTTAESSGDVKYTTTVSYDNNGTPTINISNTPNLVINSEDDDVNEPEALPEDTFVSDSAVSEADSPIADDSSNTTKTHNPKVEVIPMTEQPEPVQDDVQNEAPPVADPMLKALQDKLAENSDMLSAVMKYIDEAPRISGTGYVSDMGGSDDKNIKNTADMLKAIERGDTKRLQDVYGVTKAQTEGSGASGGYYVGEQTLNIQFPDLDLSADLPITEFPVSQPSGFLPIPNFTTVPSSTGQSADAMGIASQARAEGGAYVEESILLEKINYLVTDYASGYVKASRELLQDYSAIESLLMMGIRRDVKSRKNYAVLKGTGAGEPLGVLNWAGTIGIEEDTDNTFAYADALEMQSRLLATDERAVRWVHHPSVITQIGVMTNSNFDLVQNLSGRVVPSLLGSQRIASQHLPQVGTDGYIIYGDWSRYFMFVLGGLYIDYSEHADFFNGNAVWRFGQRIDGKPLMTDKVTLADGSFTQSPFVAINNLS